MTDELSLPEDVLAAFAALLGVNFLQEENGTTMRSNCGLDWSCIPWEPNSSNNASDIDHEGPDINFSSFPALSLERSQNEPDSTRESRKDVEAHVSALLARPILVSSTNDVEVAEDDESDNCIAAQMSEVPGLVLQNFYKSFTTLMNSRLRAYATFLARHGLALLKSAPSSDSELEEGVVGVEQKLETMLEIGRLVSTNAIVTSFQVDKTTKTTKENMDDETCEISMPIVMDAAIDISLPRPGGEGSEIVTVAFHTSGTMTGIFSNASNGSLLRVVGVDLDMSKLLSCMIEQAASVISCIIEMTNSTYSMSLPASLDEAQARGAALKNASLQTKRKACPTLVEPETTAIVSPSLQPKTKIDVCGVKELYMDEESLSPERCEHLVDFVLNETDHSMLSPPSQKKIKMMVVDAAGAVPSMP